MATPARRVWMSSLAAVTLFFASCASAPTAKSGAAAFDLAAFRKSFNAAADGSRVLVLLSPS